jgi:hypothetical protein
MKAFSETSQATALARATPSTSIRIFLSIAARSRKLLESKFISSK